MPQRHKETWENRLLPQDPLDVGPLTAADLDSNSTHAADPTQCYRLLVSRCGKSERRMASKLSLRIVKSPGNHCQKRKERTQIQSQFK